MTLKSRRELYKLRELVHFLLAGAGASIRDLVTGQIWCYFCTKPLEDYTDFVTHGNAVGPKFDIQVTIHHVDGDHHNNKLDNKALCHTSCHKSHHRRESNLARARKEQK